MMTILRFLGSLALAITLITLLGLLLTVSTLLESQHGTEFAQRFVYQTGWFDAVLSLLFLNILCSALLRWPFKKKHTGFVITHIGILILLIGCFITRLTGVEGQVLLYENDRSSSMWLQGYRLVVHRHGGQSQAVELGKVPIGRTVSLERVDPGLSVKINEFLEKSRTTHDVVPSLKPGENPAVLLKIESQALGFSEKMWLVEKSDSGETVSEKALGPATFRLLRKKEAVKEVKEPQEPHVDIHLPDGKHWSPTLKELLQKKTPEYEGYQISDVLYFPDARVGAENKIETATEEAKNPALRFDLTNRAGQKKRFVLFAFFPEFESMHARGETPALNATAQFHFSGNDQAKTSAGPSLTVFYSKEGWSFSAASSKGKTEGVVKEGETQAAGWMDFRFTAEKLLSNADVRQRLEKAQEGQPAAQLEISKNNETLFSGWLLPGRALKLDSEKDGLAIQLERNAYPLGFELHLNDFRKVDYPGTSKPMSFESDVTLSDRQERMTLQKTISMNKPLDHKGFRIFQSSYIQDEGTGEEASVFSVAKNPGIPVIYTGAVILFVGAFLVFFVPPFSSLKRG